MRHDGAAGDARPDSQMTVDGPRLVVVGSGPAGVTAAVEAARWPMHVTLVDEQARSGGQYYQTRQGSSDEGSPRYLRRMAPSVDVRQGAAVFDAPKAGVLSTWHPGLGMAELRYDFLVLATGAYDRPVAVPGWTLPGVMTAGGVHALAKGHHTGPGARVIVAGAGPFLLIVADALQTQGCRVTVVEATRRRDALSGLPYLMRTPDLLVQAAGLFLRQALHRGASHYGEMVTAIHGTDRVEGVSVARVDRDWRPIQGSERQLTADAVCLGFGFVPRLDLAQLAGCAIDYDPDRAAFLVATDDAMRTSVPHTYAAGESAGIAGMRIACLRGRLAGLTAAFDAGLVPAQRFASRHRAIQSKLTRYLPVATWLDHTYGPRDGMWDLAGAETVLCRCEDITRGEIEAALEVTEATPVAVKTLTRAGMGPCQGTICGPLLIEALRTRHGFRVPAGSRPWSVRPPLRPVPLAGLVGGPDGTGRDE